MACFLLACALLSALPILKALHAPESNKDFSLWYATGQAVLRGNALYTPDPSGQFSNMYPPFASVCIFAPLTLLGPVGLTVALCLANSVAWLVSIVLSVKLATGRALRQNPLLYWAPALCTLPYVWDNFFLGQSNLILLAVMLGSFHLLRSRRETAAGALLGLAVAFKAFPILALGYLVFRRRWRAAGATIVALLLLTLIAPAPIRGFARNYAEVGQWCAGMLGPQPDGRIAQRVSAYSAANQSLIGLTHRLTRPVVAGDFDGDPFRVNAINLGPGAAKIVCLVLAGGISGLYLWCIRRRAPAGQSCVYEGIEVAMLLGLIPLLSPIGWTYYFCWLMPVFATGLAALLQLPRGSSTGRLAAWFGAVSVGILATAALQNVNQITQALGATTLGALGAVGTLGFLLHALRSPRVSLSASIGMAPAQA